MFTRITVFVPPVEFRLLFWIGHYFRSPSLALLALQKRYGPLRDRHITTASAGLYASHGGNRCSIGYKRIEPLPQARRLVLITPSLASKSFVHHLTTSIWQLHACRAAFAPSVTAIVAAHTNAQQMLTSYLYLSFLVLSLLNLMPHANLCPHNSLMIRWVGRRLKQHAHRLFVEFHVRALES